VALYVQLVKLSREGVMRIREVARDFAKVQAFNESLGGKFLYVVACFGEYDFVALADYPDEVAALKGAAYAAAQGNATIQTLPARPIDEFFQLMSGLPK
jgi:uncharacterized protein with GYD domain